MAWYEEEQIPEIKLNILSQISGNFKYDQGYESFLRRAFANTPANSSARQIILAGCQGSPLWRELKLYEVDQEERECYGLLLTRPSSSGAQIVNNNLNITHLQTGAFSLQGDATNNGQVENKLQDNSKTKISEALEKLAEKISTSDADETVKGEVVAKIGAAKSESSVEKKISLLNSALQLLPHASDAATALSNIISMIC